MADNNKNDSGNGKRALFIEHVRAALAFIVVGFFMIITVVLLLYVLFSRTPVDLAAYASFFSQTASVYTGIVGVVIGYYFGRSRESGEAASKTSTPQQQNASDKDSGGEQQKSPPEATPAS